MCSVRILVRVYRRRMEMEKKVEYLDEYQIAELLEKERQFRELKRSLTEIKGSETGGKLYVNGEVYIAKYICEEKYLE